MCGAKGSAPPHQQIVLECKVKTIEALLDAVVRSLGTMRAVREKVRE